jgi:MFS family permease
MLSRAFLKAGHTPTLFASFLYFDFSFMVWVMLGPLGVAISRDLGLDAAQKGLMVAVPVLSGAFLRVIAGLAVDRFGPKRTGLVLQLLVLTGLAVAWLAGLQNYQSVLAFGALLGVAGASFAKTRKRQFRHSACRPVRAGSGRGLWLEHRDRPGRAAAGDRLLRLPCLREGCAQPTQGQAAGRLLHRSQDTRRLDADAAL